MICAVSIIRLEKRNKPGLQANHGQCRNCVPMFGMHFKPPKRKILLHDSTGPKPDFATAGEELDEVDRLIHFRSCISPADRISDEVSPRIQKAPLTFINLKYLWHRRDTRLTIKGRVFGVVVRSVLARFRNMVIEDRRAKTVNG